MGVEAAVLDPAAELAESQQAAFAHQLADGRMVYAENLQDVMRQCPVLGAMSVEEAGVMLALAELDVPASHATVLSEPEQKPHTDTALSGSKSATISESIVRAAHDTKFSAVIPVDERSLPVHSAPVNELFAEIVRDNFNKAERDNQTSIISTDNPQQNHLLKALHTNRQSSDEMTAATIVSDSATSGVESAGTVLDVSSRIKTVRISRVHRNIPSRTSISKPAAPVSGARMRVPVDVPAPQLTPGRHRENIVDAAKIIIEKLPAPAADTVMFNPEFAHDKQLTDLTMYPDTDISSPPEMYTDDVDTVYQPADRRWQAEDPEIIVDPEMDIDIDAELAEIISRFEFVFERTATIHSIIPVEAADTNGVPEETAEPIQAAAGPDLFTAVNKLAEKIPEYIFDDAGYASETVTVELVNAIKEAEQSIEMLFAADIDIEIRQQRKAEISEKLLRIIRKMENENTDGALHELFADSRMLHRTIELLRKLHEAGQLQRKTTLAVTQASVGNYSISEKIGTLLLSFVRSVRMSSAAA